MKIIIQNNYDYHFDLEKTLIYKFRRKISEDVSLHKYYLSEKKNYDVGENHAYVDWLVNGYEKKLLVSFINEFVRH